MPLSPTANRKPSLGTVTHAVHLPSSCALISALRSETTLNKSELGESSATCQMHILDGAVTETVTSATVSLLLVSSLGAT